jgi:hypothetical protein
MDFITDLPLTARGAANILVITDRLLKQPVFIPLSSITSDSVAQAFLTFIVANHGLPRAVVSDRGPQFTGLFWKTLCQLLGITRRLSTAFHPQTDGATERVNTELEVYLRIFCSFNQDDWDNLLPMAQLALSNRTSASTGFSPFFLSHGFHFEPIDTPIDPENATGSEISPATRGRQWVQRLRECQDLAAAAIADAQETQEKYANRTRGSAEQFKIGDKVFLRLRNIATNRPSKKLDWISLPYRVTALVGSHAVRLNTPPEIHPVFHVDLIRRYLEDPLPSQIQSFPEPPAIQPQQASEDYITGEYIVEQIRNHRRRGRGWQVLVSWRGWAEPTWEPLSDLLDTEALEVYETTLSQVPWEKEEEKEGTNVMGQGPSKPRSSPQPTSHISGLRNAK